MTPSAWLFTLIFLIPWNRDGDSLSSSLFVSAGCKKCKSKPVIAVETKKVIPIPVPYPVYRKPKCKKKYRPKTIIVTIPEKKKCYGGCGGGGGQYYYDYYAPPIYYDYYQYIDVPGGGVGGIPGGGVPLGRK